MNRAKSFAKSGPPADDWRGISPFFSLPYSFGPAWAFIGDADRYVDEARAEQADASRDASRRDVLARQERLLDAGLEETFPASDPVAVMRLT